MTVSDAVFLVLCATVIFGASLAVLLRNVFHNALALGLALFGIAGLYLYLNAEFLAVMQVILYVGAIAVAILFAVMMSHPMTSPERPFPARRVWAASALALFFFTGLVGLFKNTTWHAASAPRELPFAQLGQWLLRPFALSFEAVSLVLLLAILGALVISRERSR